MGRVSAAHEVDRLAYFVKARNGYIYKLVFTGFGGSANGNFYLSKTAILTSVADVKQGKAAMAVYPNPSTDGGIHVIYDLNTSSKTNLQVFDLSGRVLYSETLAPTTGIQDYLLPQSGLHTGMYIVRLESDGVAMTQKLVIN